MKIADLVDRQVEFFRAHIEPGILTMPKNALHHTDRDIKTMEICEVGVYVKTIPGKDTKGEPHGGREFIVPFSNCQTIRFLPKKLEEPLDPKKALPKAQ